MKDERSVTIQGTYFICGKCRNGHDHVSSGGRANRVTPPAGISEQAWRAALDAVDRASLIDDAFIVAMIAESFQAAAAAPQPEKE